MSRRSNLSIFNVNSMWSLTRNCLSVISSLLLDIMSECLIKVDYKRTNLLSTFKIISSHTPIIVIFLRLVPTLSPPNC